MVKKLGRSFVHKIWHYVLFTRITFFFDISTGVKTQVEAEFEVSTPGKKREDICYYLKVFYYTPHGTTPRDSYRNCFDNVMERGRGVGEIEEEGLIM